MKIFLRCAFLLAAYGCLGSAPTNVGDIDVNPLVRVDSAALPKTINDSTGNSLQVTHGTLTTYSYSIACDYRVDFSNGKSLSGTKTCGLVSDVRVVSDGLELILDAGEIGGPQGAHAYDFKTDIRKPCSCGRLCAGPCGADRMSDTIRIVASASFEARLAEYRAALHRR
jgi:hypothetical protein